MILVVDDEAGIRELLSMELESHGYQVQTASNGEEALERLRAQKFDLVITDMMMPRLDGMGLAKAMRADERLAKVPIIMLTAKSGAMDVIGGINAGAKHYVTKPFKHEELLSKVRKLLRLA